MYPDELPILEKYISQRIAGETYRDAIVAINPHSKNPKQFLTELKYEMEDRDYIEQEVLDKGSLAILKDRLSGGGTFGAK